MAKLKKKINKDRQNCLSAPTRSVGTHDDANSKFSVYMNIIIQVPTKVTNKI